MRLPYELVSVQADALLIQMIVTGNLEYWWDYYQEYIKACGWTDQEFDAETLRHVSEGWDNTIWN